MELSLQIETFISLIIAPLCKRKISLVTLPTFHLFACFISKFITSA